ncbi:MAG: lysophospholipid acyltransferase family protein [Ignavibacteria bacterium]|nr:lysophospholipid acyltransferase family protein [Ignavibacteria bacterium]
MKAIGIKILHRLIALVSSTWRIKVIGECEETPAVFAFWHGEMLPIWKYFSQKIEVKFAIVSLSKDGQILAELLEKWNYFLIRGSSSKNSKDVLEKATELAKNASIFITPDGPRGPARKFKNGAAIIAYRSEVPLYLVRAFISGKIIFKKSWDKFILPLPFSKIRIVISEKYYIPKELTREEVSEMITKIENIINSIR